MRGLKSLAAVAFLAVPSISMGALYMNPYTSFGGGDGWLSPGEGGQTYLGTANNERGLAYGNNHLYLVSRSGGSNIRILDSTTGADLGGLSTTGITGGTFAINTAAVGGDGVVYVNNLTTNNTTSPFKVYKWTNEAAAPVVAYTGNAGLAGARVGDSLAATGSGASTLLAAGFGSTPVVAGNNGFSVVDPTAGTASAVGFTGTPPNAGDFRLGLTFGADAAHVFGSQGSGLYRYVSYSGIAGTLITSQNFPDPAGNTADRLMAYAVVGGTPVLAVQSTGDGHVTLYDVSNPASPQYIAYGLNIVGAPVANSNGSGQLAWKMVDANHAILYAMSTNSGIQAFTVEIPEPGSLGLIVLAGLCLRRRPR